eukprot:62451_1
MAQLQLYEIDCLEHDQVIAFLHEEATKDPESIEAWALNSSWEGPLELTEDDIRRLKESVSRGTEERMSQELRTSLYTLKDLRKDTHIHTWLYRLASTARTHDGGTKERLNWVRAVAYGIAWTKEQVKIKNSMSLCRLNVKIGLKLHMLRKAMPYYHQFNIGSVVTMIPLTRKLQASSLVGFLTRLNKWYTRATDGGVRMVFIDWDEFDDASAQRAFNIVADIWMECHRDNKKIQDVPYKFPKFPVDLIQQVGRSFVDSIQQIEAPDPPVIQAASSSAAPPPRPMQDLHLLIVKMDKLSCVCDDMSIIIHQLMNALHNPENVDIKSIIEAEPFQRLFPKLSTEFDEKSMDVSDSAVRDSAALDSAVDNGDLPLVARDSAVDGDVNELDVDAARNFARHQDNELNGQQLNNNNVLDVQQDNELDGQQGRGNEQQNNEQQVMVDRNGIENSDYKHQDNVDHNVYVAGNVVIDDTWNYAQTFGVTDDQLAFWIDQQMQEMDVD